MSCCCQGCHNWPRPSQPLSPNCEKVYSVMSLNINLLHSYNSRWDPKINPRRFPWCRTVARLTHFTKLWINMWHSATTLCYSENYNSRGSDKRTNLIELSTVRNIHTYSFYPEKIVKWSSIAPDIRKSKRINTIKIDLQTSLMFFCVSCTVIQFAHLIFFASFHFYQFIHFSFFFLHTSYSFSTWDLLTSYAPMVKPYFHPNLSSKAHCHRVSMFSPPIWYKIGVHGH